MAEAADSPLDAIEARIGAGLRADASALDLLEATARVLLALGAGGEGSSMRDVARRIARDPSTVTRFVARAAGDGLVEQRPGTEDRRERRLHLTAKGRQVRAALLARRQARATWLKEAVQTRTGLVADEVDWLLRVLDEGLSTSGTAVNA